jgi:2-haloacid dehalogenase
VGEWVIFDVYGTLLDVESGVGAVGPLPVEFASLWRTKQLEYSWTSQVSGDYQDFWELTCRALDYTIAATAAGGDNRAALLAAYAALPVFVDVLGALEALRSNGHHVAVLSNGTMSMLELALSSSKLEGLLDIIISIDEIAVYKPDRRAYELALRHLEVAPSEVRFVSANAWDAAGARAAGLSVTWVNRDHRPPEYQIPSSICDLNDFVKELAGT